MEAWAGYFGWLHAPFKPNKNAENYTSWAEIHGDDAWIPEPPSFYIAEWFSKLGRCTTGFNGPIVLPWSEIQAFIQSMRIDALEWEVEALRRMSAAYVNWYNKTSSNQNIDPPILPDEDTLKRIQAANSRHMKQLMKG